VEGKKIERKESGEWKEGSEGRKESEERE